MIYISLHLGYGETFFRIWCALELDVRPGHNLLKLRRCRKNESGPMTTKRNVCKRSKRIWVSSGRSEVLD
jgi:hypothetical protein